MRRGYAILDFETTGLSPKHGDRILEVGAVYMQPDLRIDGGLETLVNPKRDVGPTRVHGISARDVFDAPTFDRVAPALLKMLDGRVIVGHNIAFDLRFLEAELVREGYDVPDFVAIDTMHVARTLYKKNPPPSFKLGDLSRHLGIEIDAVFEYIGMEKRPAHSALGDSLLTAFVFSHLVQQAEGAGFWDHHLSLAEATEWPEYVPVEIAAKRRGDVHQATTQEVSAVAGPVSATAVPNAAAEAGSIGGSIADVLRAFGAERPQGVSTAAYADLLDSAIEDRVLDRDEVDALVSMAEALGLDTATLGSLHRGQFDQVVLAAWADGVLDDRERIDVLRVAQLLGIDDDTVTSALRGSPSRVVADSVSDQDRNLTRPHLVLEPNSLIVLTGDMRLERNHIEAHIVSLGHRVGANVTKKTSIVIAADPYTQSGKARKARDYGIHVLGQDEGFVLLGLTD